MPKFPPGFPGGVLEYSTVGLRLHFYWSGSKPPGSGTGTRNWEFRMCKSNHHFSGPPSQTTLSNRDSNRDDGLSHTQI